ncbi:MAG: hypothetical protein HYV97_18735 [Bdellovibrio sp.]|nr:hypothetical protein [Bdellovibrio sp.]
MPIPLKPEGRQIKILKQSEYISGEFEIVARVQDDLGFNGREIFMNATACENSLRNLAAEAGATDLYDIQMKKLYFNNVDCSALALKRCAKGNECKKIEDIEKQTTNINTITTPETAATWYLIVRMGFGSQIFLEDARDEIKNSTHDSETSTSSVQLGLEYIRPLENNRNALGLLTSLHQVSFESGALVYFSTYTNYAFTGYHFFNHSFRHGTYMKLDVGVANYELMEGERVLIDTYGPSLGGGFGYGISGKNSRFAMLLNFETHVFFVGQFPMADYSLGISYLF